MSICTFDSFSSTNSMIDEPEFSTLQPIIECSTGNSSMTSLANFGAEQHGPQFELLPQSMLRNTDQSSHGPGTSLRLRNALPRITAPRPISAGQIESAYTNPAFVQDEDSLSLNNELFHQEPKSYGRQVSFESPKPQNTADLRPPDPVPPSAPTPSTDSPNQLSTKESQETEHLKAKEKLPDWDRFVTIPPPDEDETQKSEWVEITIRWFKIFSYFFTFVVVLVFSVFSKSIILLMTSMTSVDHRIPICNKTYYYINPPLDHDKEYVAIYPANGPERQVWSWCLYFATITPYTLSFIRSIRICYFKKFKVAKFTTILTVFLTESLHCIGLSIFLFVVLPRLDVQKGAMMMNCVCLVPSFVRLFVNDATGSQDISLTGLLMISQSESGAFNHNRIARSKLLSRINFVLQLIIILAWTAIGYYEEVKGFYLIPICLILVSFEWWENYVVPGAMNKWLGFLDEARKDLNKTRYFVYSFMSLWKVLFIFMLMLLNEYVINGKEVTEMMFTNFTDGFDTRAISVVRDKNNFEAHMVLDSEHHRLYLEAPLWPLWFLLIHIGITYTTYAFAKFTCKVCFQGISFAIPLCITVPTTVSLLWAFSSISFQDKCKLSNVFPAFEYIFWNTGSIDMFDFSNAWINIAVAVVWFLGLINQVSNTLHIWKETSEGLASTEQLFVNTMFNAAIIDQSLVLNRRCLKLTFNPEEEDKEEVKDAEIGSDSTEPNNNWTNEKMEKDINNNPYQKLPVDKLDGPIMSYNPLLEMTEQINEILEQKEGQKLDPEDDWTQDWFKVCEKLGIEEDSIDAKPDPEDDETIRIYICATMWHEDRNEMVQMLKAVMRLDYEQGVRRIARENFGDDVKKVIYEMEVNIFFDDAFEQGPTDDEDDRAINRFVEQLIDTINDAANQVLEKNIKMEDPIIMGTSYGGKLIWRMPMNSRLIAHIKDKNLIRHRKRWSQCMYMYYLLGYRLAARKDLDMNRKKTIMNNTFVLALDGDINFRPEAVDMVVDLMKKNSRLGAACGRIHPIGSGPIVWYQKFEYAIGHWQQKATEHVFGCVLCSPGCFSLFRARALMDKSVMNKYTLKPTEARHYVQYDQGEDRWLCTLLLQRGWRIEYCAASDSFTHAPEGFAEFYTQRRRWTPSTMANVLDLLGDYKQTVKVNENISYLYIFYQGFLMLGTIISPGTIFLMVVNALNTVMSLNTRDSLFCNLIPILAFIFVCHRFKDNNIKITFAMVLSVIYALLMLAVLVGIGIDMYQQGFLSPNSLFFSAMMASFVVAGILHPQEFACVLSLPIYMLFIPSMYMLLTIYSVTNMHIVAWGTREVKSKLSAKELAKQKEEEEAAAAAAAAAAAKKKSFNFLNMANYGNKHGLFTCMCCSGANDDTGTIQEINLQVKEMKQLMSNINTQFKRSNSIEKKETADNDTSAKGEDDKDANDNEEEAKEGQTTKKIQKKPAKPRWVTNNARLNTFSFKWVHHLEEEFWTKMVAKYLYPLDEDRKEKERIQTELEDLRTQCVFAFGFINVIFILIVFMLQVHKDVFGIDIPVGVKSTNTTFLEDEDRVVVTTEYNWTRMDPITLTLVVFFGAILIVQCIGMFIHRFGTLAHLLAYTEINEKKRDFDPTKFVKKVLQQRNRNENNDGDEKVSLKSEEQAKPSDYLKTSEAFNEEMSKIETDSSHLQKMGKIMRKNTMHAMSRRTRQWSFNKQDRRRSTACSEDIGSCGSSSGTRTVTPHPSIRRDSSTNSRGNWVAPGSVPTHHPVATIDITHSTSMVGAHNQDTKPRTESIEMSRL